MKEGQLCVWWIPQIPMTSFMVLVESLEQGRFLLEVLAAYDQFQFENNIKLDYANVGGLSMYENGEWTDWYDDDGGNVEDYVADRIIEQDGKHAIISFNLKGKGV